MTVSGRYATEVGQAAPAARLGGGSSVGQRLAGWGGLPVLIVAVLTMVGVAIRASVAHQALLADELSTYWIITTNGLQGVVSSVHGSFEITPPLYFVASWLTTQIGHAPELVRAPSLVAGGASIPVIYLLGLRTVGRLAALVAAALTALAPFMIYYSTEARGYALMMALVLLSTLVMLLAVDTQRAGWWVVYAAASCGAVYTHYTSVFVLGAQFLWLWWAHPEARKPALLATLGALVAFLPWTTGLINDLNSPNSKSVSVFSAGDAHTARLYLEHWAIGYPGSSVGLRDLPGAPALVLLTLALIVAVTGLAVSVFRGLRRARLVRPDRRLVIVVVLALSVPVGEALLSAVGTNLFSVRNLAASWPGFALLFAALLVAAGPRLRFAAAALAIAAYALGAAKMLDVRYQRPDYRAAADFIDRHAGPRDVLIDESGSVVSAGPLTALDVALQGRHRVFRAGEPAERNRPFRTSDPITSLAQAIPKAVAAARGGRVFVAGDVFFPVDRRVATQLERTRPLTSPFPTPYRLVETHAYPGTDGVEVTVYADDGSAPAI